MKVTDNAMWLLTVALKEHIKNILNDSIEYKKGLTKGKLPPQAIRYPNVLANTSNKSRKISKGRSSAASLDNGQKKRINSIDLFAALNMLPSGNPSSVGGSVSRMSLEQTFFSGFNSIPSFEKGNTFKDVQNFISNTISEMAKNRKPEEKKAKVSNTKSPKGRQTKSATRPENNAKTPSPRLAALPSSDKASQSNTTPLPPMLESPPLISTLSPANVQTPVVDSSLPKVEPSKVVAEKLKAITIVKTSPANTSQESDDKASESTEAKAPKVEKPAEKPVAALPPQPGPPRPGAGRGAKNLAALMARAADSTSQRSLNQGVEKNGSVNMNRTSSSASMNAVSNPQKPSNPEQNPPQSQQFVANPANPPSNNNGNQPASTASGTDTRVDGAGKERLPIPPQRQAPIAPVRRGKGKGFGSKDLAAMRARSMAAATQTGGADPKKSN